MIRLAVWGDNDDIRAFAARSGQADTDETAAALAALGFREADN